MPVARTTVPRQAKVRLVRASEAATRLGLTLKTFQREYQRRFTDRRPADMRRHGVPVLIPEDEVDLVISDGWEAMADYRRKLGR